jgi:hypothetical protein
LLARFSAATVQGEFALEFLDDFTKPAHYHRDPLEERIETERQDFTQSTKSVGRGVVQVEAGYSYFCKDEAGEIEATHATPEMLWRIGLSEGIDYYLTDNWIFDVRAGVGLSEDSEDLFSGIGGEYRF